MKRVGFCSLAVQALVVVSGCTDPFVAQVEQVRRGKSDLIHAANRPVDDGELVAIRDLTGLRELLVDDAGGVTDRGLECLSGLRRLEHLRLGGAPIGDEGIRRLAGLARLRLLNLPDAQFSDAGLQALANLPRLELLRFHSSRVTDAGMVYVAQMPSLRFLHLIRVPITDQGLAHLESLTRLESLYLDEVPVTDDGIEHLLKALPALHLHVNQDHHERDPHRDDHTH